MTLLRRVAAYLQARAALFLFYLAAIGVALAMGALAETGMENAHYAALLMTFFFGLIVFVDGGIWFRRRRALARLLGRLPAAADELPEADGVEGDYRELLLEQCREVNRLDTALREQQSDTRDYYTLWVHQIKTPISAMRLVLQDMDAPETAVLRQELFKIEQYADLALRYVKLSDIASDLMPERCNLQDVVREAVKKFSLLFIYQKLTVTFGDLSGTVVSDRRWLLFILEQILSNAVKYTKSGGVHIGMEDGALVIADTGIGIRAADLPRIFEKGYTGYNGRLDTRASGIGLYLVRRTSEALGIRVTVASEEGRGTRVSLRFPAEDGAARGM